MLRGGLGADPRDQNPLYWGIFIRTGGRRGEERKDLWEGCNKHVSPFLERREDLWEKKMQNTTCLVFSFNLPLEKRSRGRGCDAFCLSVFFFL